MIDFRRVRAPWHSERWPIAARASLSMGLSAGLGWMLVGFPAGMLTTLGAFTSLYVPARPYANRAIALAAVAAAITLMVGAGMELRPFGWTSAAMVVFASALITFMANATRIGPPGAYLIVLAGAAGTSLPATLVPGRVELLVALGGLVSWLIHMSGSLREPRGPERRPYLPRRTRSNRRFRQPNWPKSRNCAEPPRNLFTKPGLH